VQTYGRRYFKFQVWDPALTEAQMQDKLLRLSEWPESVNVMDSSATLSPSVIATATPENTSKAKQFVQNLTSESGKNVQSRLTMHMHEPVVCLFVCLLQIF
jgi:hypothetical protein